MRREYTVQVTLTLHVEAESDYEARQKALDEVSVPDLNWERAETNVLDSVEVEGEDVTCWFCDGIGKNPVDRWYECAICDGAGVIDAESDRADEERGRNG